MAVWETIISVQLQFASLPLPGKKRFRSSTGGCLTYHTRTDGDQQAVLCFWNKGFATGAAQDKHQTTNLVVIPPRWKIQHFVEVLNGNFPLLKLARQSPCQRWRNKICHCVLPAHAGDCLPALLAASRRQPGLVKRSIIWSSRKAVRPPRYHLATQLPFPLKRFLLLLL